MMRLFLVFALLGVIMSSTLQNFNIVNKKNMPVGYDGRTLVIGSPSQREHPNFIWNAVIAGKTSRKFKLVNKGLKVVLAFNGIHTWSAIAQNTVLEPPMAFTPVGIANGEVTFSESTEVWNVENNSYDAGTKICMYGQQHQSSISANEVFFFVNTSYKVGPFTSNTNQWVGEIYDTHSHLKHEVGEMIKVFETVEKAIAAF